MEDPEKTPQIPATEKEAKELESALNSQMQKYGIAIIPCKKEENGTKWEDPSEEKEKEDIKTFEKKEARKKRSLSWTLGFLGFMGIRGIAGILKGNYLEAIWLIWFLWFGYFIPRKNPA